jgi:hypothetical protein
MVSRLFNKFFELTEPVHNVRDISGRLAHGVSETHCNVPLKLQPEKFPHYFPPRYARGLFDKSVEHLFKLLAVRVKKWIHRVII